MMEYCGECDGEVVDRGFGHARFFCARCLTYRTPEEVHYGDTILMGQRIRQVVTTEECVIIPVAGPRGFGQLYVGPLEPGESDTVKVAGRALTITRVATKEDGMAQKRSDRAERTSAEIASVAASILSGQHVSEALGWLQEVVENPLSLDGPRQHAVVLIAAVLQARRVADSALTQRERP